MEIFSIIQIVKTTFTIYMIVNYILHKTAQVYDMNCINFIDVPALDKNWSEQSACNSGSKLGSHCFC